MARKKNPALPSGDNITVFTQARVVQPGRVTAPTSLTVRNGRISAIGGRAPPGRNVKIVNAHGRFILPGYIDIHCHGDGAKDFFTEGNVVAANLLAKGTTGVLATLGYNDMQSGKLAAQVQKFWEARDETAHQTVLGIHLEGPYVNSKYGALVRPGSLNHPVPSEYHAVLDRWSKVVKLWTLAPELEGSDDFVNAVAARGIIMAAGHTEAGAERLTTLVSRGLRVATHWSNATGVPPPRFRGTRSAGVDEFALMEPRVMAELICDAGGFHVPPAMVNLLYRTKGPGGIILISDAYWVTGGQRPDAAKYDVILTHDGDLCGSKLCMAEAARNFMKFTDCTLPEISRMGALNAAELFGWADDLGSVEVGKIANLLVTDAKLMVKSVWLAGQRVPSTG